jgi:hypothetical protein
MSSLRSGSLTSGEARTSATLTGSRFSASGLSDAHSLAATATLASCSRVVPYSCIWRCVTIA